MTTAANRRFKSPKKRSSILLLGPVKLPMKSADIKTGDVCLSLLYEDGTAVLTIQPNGPGTTCVVACSLLNLYAASKGTRYQSSGSAGKVLIERKDDDMHLFVISSVEHRYRVPHAEFEAAVETLFTTHGRVDVAAYAL